MSKCNPDYKLNGQNTSKKSKRTTRMWTRRFDAWRESRRGNKYSAPRSINRNLNTVLKHFYAEVVKESCNEYEPNCLKAMMLVSLVRHLKKTWESHSAQDQTRSWRKTTKYWMVTMTWWCIIHMFYTPQPRSPSTFKGCGMLEQCWVSLPMIALQPYHLMCRVRGMIKIISKLNKRLNRYRYSVYCFENVTCTPHVWIDAQCTILRKSHVLQGWHRSYKSDTAQVHDLCICKY